MSLDVSIDPQTASLLTAIGLTDGDGELVPGWFDHPLKAIRRVLSNPTQRAALLRLLDELLPPDAATPGWYPLLDTEGGNLYLTVEDDVIGIAGALHSADLGDGIGQVRASVRLPLVSVADDLEAVAGTAAGPLQVGVELGFTGPDLPMTAVGASVTVHLDETALLGVQAGVRVTVDDFHLDGGDPVDLVVDSADIGAGLVGVLRLLLQEVVDKLAEESPDNDRLTRLAAHFFDLLGLGDAPAIPPLPLEQLFDDPQAVPDWLVDIIDSPTTLTAWATHLAGLLGDDLPVSGSGTEDAPFRARLLDSAVVDLDLLVASTADRELVLGLDARVDTGPVALSAAVTLLRIPLPALAGQPIDPTAPPRSTQVVPEVTVSLVGPSTGNLVDNAPDVRVGSVRAGFRLRDQNLEPWLALTKVMLNGDDHGTVDLTDADAVIGVAADAALGALEDAFGDSPLARALLSLLGLRRPDTDPTTPHLLDPAALGRGPTVALGALHRAILADAAHPWSHLLGEVAVLLGLTPAVTGSGTTDAPWVTPIAGAGPATLALAAWNAHTDADPEGLQRLRLGVHAGAAEGVFAGGLLIEVLAIDLPASGNGSVALIGRSQLSIGITPDQPLDLSGLQVTCTRAGALAGWRPGEPPVASVGLIGVELALDGETYGPYDWTLPGLQPDLGLGADAIRLLGHVLGSAVGSWGGEPARALTALLGLHRDVADLPDDWPLLGDLLAGDDQLQQLLDDPAGALRGHLTRVLTGVSAGGSPFADDLLALIGRILPDTRLPDLFGLSGFDGSTPDLGALRSVTGAGRYDDPWAIPVIDRTDDAAHGVTSVDALAWLDPAGPPAGWIATVARLVDEVSDGHLLASFLLKASAYRPELAMLLGGRNLDALGNAFGDLADWLNAGDGLVPLASQLPDGWTHGTTVSVPHGLLPTGPQVISQVVTRLSSGSGPVLLVAAPFADHTLYDDLVIAITGAPPAAGRHFDLRALPDPSEVDLSQVVATAGVFTADLLADNAVGEADQLRSVLERLRTLTGLPVRVVGHSSAGVVARTLAAAHPELVADLVTLGSPHAGSDLAPLVDDALAAAVRVAASVAGPIADSVLGATTRWLAGLMDGTGGELGGSIRPGWFAGVAGGLVDPAPGLAIGSQLSGDLIGLLSGAAVAGLSAAGDPPTHLCVGLRLGLATPGGTDGGPAGIAFTAGARVDLARLRLAAGAPEPARPAVAVTLETVLSRPDGWLVGQGTLGAGPITARVRRVHAGVMVSTPGPTPPGGGADAPAAGAAAGLGTTAWLRLVDASVDASPVRTSIDLDHPDLRAGLDAVLAELSVAAADPTARATLDLLEAAGVVVDTSEGPRASIQGLGDLATVPIRTLTARRAQLLSALRELIGDPDLTGVDLGGLDPDALAVTLPELPLLLALDDDTMVLRLATTSDVTLAGPFRIGGRLDLDTRTLVGTLDVAVQAGPVVLRRAPDATLTLTAEPWATAPLVLRPLDPAAVQSRLVDLLPDLSVSAVMSALLGDLAGSGISVPPVSALVRDPGAWLRRPEALGTVAGLLDGERINALLTAVAQALGLDDTQGLALPGGFLLRASGTDPLRVELSGGFGDAGDPVSATVGLAVEVRPTGPLPTDVQVTGAGDVTLDLTLPGDWGDVTIAFSGDATRVRLVVTAANVDPIQLLPTVSGLGNLLGSAVTALVPRALQEVTDALRANPAQHPILDVALQVAEALGIYAAGTGFTADPQVQRLRNMLDPGWLESQVTVPAAAAIIGHIQSLFPSTTSAGVIPLPGHQVSRVGNRLLWQMDLFSGCVLGAELGWATDGHPQVMVTLTGLDTGPVTIVEARMGYLDDLEGLVRVRLDVGDPLAWFAPELELGVAGGRLTSRVLPLGDTASDHPEVMLLPTPAFTATAEGGLQIAGSWLLPLLTQYAVPQLVDLLDGPLWTNGPTARRILHGAGLVTTNTGPLKIAMALPEPPVIAMRALRTAFVGATATGDAVSEVVIDVTDTLHLSFAEQDGRLGIRLQGYVTIPGDSVTVTFLAGKHEWIGTGRGVTAWLVADSTQLPVGPAPQLPVAPAPGLDVRGVGLQIAGPDDDQPLFGGDEGSAVRLGGIAAMLFGTFDFWDQTTRGPTFAVDSLGAAVELSNTAVRVNGSDGDSFVSKIIPEELAAGFTTTIAYRDKRLEVHGGPGDLDNGIELTFPLNLNVLDVIFLRELYLAAVFDQPTEVVAAIAAISGNAELGPIAVTVTRVGLRVTIGDSGAVLSFKAPDGFGMSLDTSSIRLGGFLLVDEARGRYVGALEIAVLNKFALTAIGIVTTKRPDGSPGFSLLMLVTVTLPVPIPLGYGFFFSGAGGLLGLNRGMDVDRIRDGLRTGTADSILFPTDVVNRIDVIIRDLEESFPEQDGHFLIAPVAMIQWMNPALVTLKIGLILEIAPQPNIALLGVLRLTLPTAEEAVVDLKVAFIGGIDVAASLLYFDAAIYDSFIGYGDFKLSLEGDIAIRLCWGAKPDLVASIGGFHPSYTPAAHLNLPAMRRLTLSLLKDNPRITLRLYFAVTSNTIQFGAELELFVGTDGFSISGDLGFDVLVQFAPFLIDAHMCGRLAVTAGGADICSLSLDLSLRGPTPWNAHGRASFKILFVSISVEIEATFGDAHETALPSEPALPKVIEALSDPLAWTAELSASASAGVVLRPLPAGELVVDAGGLLSARQNLVPLETDIGLVGKTPPSDVSRVSITALSIGAQAVEFADVTTPFAPSTFAGVSSTGDDLLRAPAYEERPNGVQATSGRTLEADTVLYHPQSYEMIVIDDPDPQAPTPPAVAANPRLAFSRLVAGGAIGSSTAARKQRKLAERGAVCSATATEPRFAVTTTASLVPLGSDGRPAPGDAQFLTRTEAEQLLAAAPTDRHHLQIVPEAQVVH